MRISFLELGRGGVRSGNNRKLGSSNFFRDSRFDSIVEPEYEVVSISSRRDSEGCRTPIHNSSINRRGLAFLLWVVGTALLFVF